MLNCSLWVTACLKHTRPYSPLSTKPCIPIQLIRTRSLYSRPAFPTQLPKDHSNKHAISPKWTSPATCVLHLYPQGLKRGFVLHLSPEASDSVVAGSELSWWYSEMNGQSWQPYCADIQPNRTKASKLWLCVQRARREYVWYSMVFFDLRRNPQRALVHLDVAIHSKWLTPPSRILEDCIKTLAEKLIQEPATPQAADIRALHQLTCDYAKMHSSDHMDRPFQQKIIWLLLDHCNEDGLRSLFRCLLTYNLPLTSHTLLHFAEKFLDLGEYDLGLEIIRSAVNVGVDLSSYALQSSCVRLLRTRPREPIYKIQAETVNELLGMNIKPNVPLWTCIIHNAVNAKDYKEAWRWYDTGISDGLKPNLLTFLVLLKMAKDGNDQDVLHRVTEDAWREGILPNDLDLVFDLLHTRLLLDRQRPDSKSMGDWKSFQELIHVYNQYCNLEPLMELGIRVNPILCQDQRGRQLPAPTPNIVSIILLAYIGLNRGRKVVKDVYDRYHDLVKSGHPIIAPIASTDHIGNAFVLALGSSLNTLHFCAGVIKDMLQSSPIGSSSSSKFPSTTPHQTGQPTLQTWNIMINSYMKHRNIEAAEKVLSILRNRNFKPSVYTWSHLIQGYAYQQDVDKVVGALRAMKEADIEYNEYTIAYLQRLHNKPRFFKALDKMDKEFNETRMETNRPVAASNDSDSAANLESVHLNVNKS